MYRVYLTKRKSLLDACTICTSEILQGRPAFAIPDGKGAFLVCYGQHKTKEQAQEIKNTILAKYGIKAHTQKEG